jgi:predicted DNA binding CopG/RHH family protein
MDKKFPKFENDEEFVRFFETTDLSDYMNAKNMVPTHKLFEFESKNKTVTMRMPERLFSAIKARAARKRMPYQRFMRSVLEEAVRKKETTKK